MRTPPLPSAVLLASALALVAATPLAAQAAGGSTLRGRITSQAGQPLAGALVIRSFIRPDTVRADSAGRYVVQGLARGRHVFQVKHPGFEMIELDLTLPVDTVLDVDVPLQPAAVAATAPGGVLERVGFTRRRVAADSRRSRVTFLGPEEIAASQATRVSQLLEGATDLRVRADARGAVLYGDGGRCVLRIMVDGFLERTRRYVDEILEVRELAAAEVYPRASQIPREFEGATQLSGNRDFETRSDECGAILLWRR